MPDGLLIARQPILDARRRIFAYELMLQSVAAAPQAPSGGASQQGFIKSLVECFSPQILAAGRLISVRVAVESVLDREYALLPAGQTIIELDLAAGAAANEALVQACGKLTKEGYQLCARGAAACAGNPSAAAILDAASLVKCEPFEWGGNAARVVACRQTSRKVIANGVMTQDQYKAATEAGADLFQGFFFFKPQVLQQREIPAVKVNFLRFLQAVSQPEMNVKELEKLIRQDAAISMALLKLINSAAFGLRHEISSIERALVLLGEIKVRQWAASLAAKNLASDKPPDLLFTALIRAFLCEALACHAGMEKRRLDMFMVGIISGLPAMLDVPLQKLLDELSVGAEMREVLAEGTSRLARIFSLAVAHESGDFTKMTMLASETGIDANLLAKTYFNATNEVKQIIGTPAKAAA